MLCPALGLTSISVIAVLSAGLIASRADAIVTFEAEGAVGSDFTNGTDDAIHYISISTTNINGGNPGNANRVASCSGTFPAAGTYNLYARLRVGPGSMSVSDQSEPNVVRMQCWPEPGRVTIARANACECRLRKPLKGVVVPAAAPGIR